MESKDLNQLKSDLTALRRDFEAFRNETRSNFQSLKEEIRAGFDNLERIVLRAVDRRQ